ncbi:MAG: CCA tRNA nucleotidyltransferase, partial [Rhodobacteraceae bacterium]|nr:CCA tRNA nucleotidyltransferase [Paracoccaceae bacterium]
AYRYGADIAQDALALSAAFAGHLPMGASHEIAEGAAAMLPVSAVDLPADLKGPAIGQALREMESRWIASGFTLTKDELLR